MSSEGSKKMAPDGSTNKRDPKERGSISAPWAKPLAWVKAEISSLKKGQGQLLGQIHCLSQEVKSSQNSQVLPHTPPPALPPVVAENLEKELKKTQDTLQALNQRQANLTAASESQQQQFVSRMVALEHQQTSTVSASQATTQALEEIKMHLESIKQRQNELHDRQEALEERLQSERHQSIESVRTSSPPVPVAESLSPEDSLINLAKKADDRPHTESVQPMGLDDLFSVPDVFNDFGPGCINPTTIPAPPLAELIDFSDEEQVPMGIAPQVCLLDSLPPGHTPVNVYEWTKEFDTIGMECGNEGNPREATLTFSTMGVQTEGEPRTEVKDQEPQRSRISVSSVGNQTQSIIMSAATVQTDKAGSPRVLTPSSTQTDLTGASQILIPSSTQTDLTGASLLNGVEQASGETFNGRPVALVKGNGPLSSKNKTSLEKHKSALVDLVDGDWLAAILQERGYMKAEDFKSIIGTEGNQQKVEKTLDVLNNLGDVGFDGLIMALIALNQQGLAALLAKCKDPPSTTLKFRLDFAPKQGKSFNPASIHKLTTAEQHMNSHWSSSSWQQALTSAISRCGYPVLSLNQSVRSVEVAIYSTQAVDSLLQETRSTGSSNLSQAIGQVVLTEDVQENVGDLDLVVKCSTNMDTQTSLKMRTLLTLQKEPNINSAGRDDAISRSRRQDNPQSAVPPGHPEVPKNTTSARNIQDEVPSSPFVALFPRWQEMKSSRICLGSTNSYLEREFMALKQKVKKLQDTTIKDLEEENENLQDTIDQEREAKSSEIEKVKTELEDQLKTKDSEISQLNEKCEELKQAKDMELDQVLQDLRDKEAELSKLQKEYQESSVQATATITQLRAMCQQRLVSVMRMPGGTTPRGGLRGGLGRGNIMYTRGRGTGRGTITSPHQSPNNIGSGDSNNQSSDGATVLLDTMQRSAQYNNIVEDYQTSADNMYNDSLENDIGYGDDVYETYGGATNTAYYTTTAGGNTAYYTAPLGLATVLCLDLSGSMAGDPFNQVKGAIRSLLNNADTFAYKTGYQERISIVVFGRETAVKVPLTNNTDQLEKCLESLSPRGLSPLGQAFEAATKELKDTNASVNLYGFKIPPRILIFSDGNLSAAQAGDGGQDDDDEDVTKPQDIPLYQFMESLQSYALTTDKNNLKAKIVFIGCGNKNKDILTSAAKTVNGNYFDIDDEEAMDSIGLYYRRLVKICNFQASYHNMTGKCDAKADEVVFGSTLMTTNRRKNDGLGEHQLEDMELKTMYKLYCQLHKEGHLLCSHSRGTKDTSEVEGRLPLGTRVRRGADYCYGDEDGYGVGTVIGYDEKGSVGVSWDSSNIILKYRYGHGGCYDVLAVDEPRKLAPGDIIKIGVRVQRGPDWMYKDIDGGPGSKGVVYNLAENGAVRVRWDNGNLLDCRFGFEGFFDLVVCPEAKSA
ncbi:uncharacterized protein LOC106178347 [Lingula anatina]|uniref:Uncharacterized protein LOC106178347 n=1 Tax=Lingula anatina TaxID=7574 RepID=A0A1S3K2S5_LINAN|nr:uncharacterized protein LOC106178347 [Lingula anatina]|eukprot:XP_013416938.1 uncharacterized protein LOC106178347 [Lingula anatina]